MIIKTKKKISFKIRKNCPVCNSKSFSDWNINKKSPLKAFKCNKCSLVFMNKILDIQCRSDFYKGYNYNRNIQNKINEKNRRKMYKLDYKYVSKFITNKSSILDIGCGMGDFLNFFKNNTVKHGIELDNDAINRGKINHPSIKFYSDYNIFEKKNIKFDCIIFRGTFQYVDDIKQLLNKCYSSLKKKGVLVILSLPNATSPLADLQRENWSMYSKYEHINFYNLNILFNLFKNKFEIINIKYPYLNTPYSNPIKDTKNVINMLMGKKKFLETKTPFWGSLINLIAVKK